MKNTQRNLMVAALVGSLVVGNASVDAGYSINQGEVSFNDLAGETALETANRILDNNLFNQLVQNAARHFIQQSAEPTHQYPRRGQGKPFTAYGREARRFDSERPSVAWDISVGGGFDQPAARETISKTERKRRLAEHYNQSGHLEDVFPPVSGAVGGGFDRGAAAGRYNYFNNLINRLRNAVTADGVIDEKELQAMENALVQLLALTPKNERAEVNKSLSDLMSLAISQHGNTSVMAQAIARIQDRFSASFRRRR